MKVLGKEILNTREGKGNEDIDNNTKLIQTLIIHIYIYIYIEMHNFIRKINLKLYKKKIIIIKERLGS